MVAERGSNDRENPSNPQHSAGIRCEVIIGLGAARTDGFGEVTAAVPVGPPRIDSVRLLEVVVAMEPRIVDGDLLEQDVEAIVNAWNRNIIPWWLLLPQGVSGAIKRSGGLEPFRELGRRGAIPLGGAVETCAGRLVFRSIIHVAGINMLWRSSERSIREAVRNSMALAKEKGYRSIAFPLIGAGSGGKRPADVLEFMRDELRSIEFDGEVRIVRFRLDA